MNPVIESLSNEHKKLTELFQTYKDNREKNPEIAEDALKEFKKEFDKQKQIEETVLFPFLEEKTGMEKIGPTYCRKREHAEIQKRLGDLDLRRVRQKVTKVLHIKTLTDDLTQFERGAFAVAKAMVLRSGPAAGFPLEGGAFIRTAPELELPDVQFHFSAGNLMSLIRQPFSAPSTDHTRPDAFMCHACLLRPESRGPSPSRPARARNATT